MLRLVQGINPPAEKKGCMMSSNRNTTRSGVVALAKATKGSPPVLIRACDALAFRGGRPASKHGPWGHSVHNA